MNQGAASTMENEPGVYLLFKDQRLVYVGRSKNPPNRISSHRKNGRPFDHAVYLTCKAADVAWIERALIEAMNPPQNKMGVVNPQPEPEAAPVVPIRPQIRYIEPAREDPRTPLSLTAARRRVGHFHLHHDFDAAVKSGELRSVPFNPSHERRYGRRLVTVGDLGAWADAKLAERANWRQSG